MQNEKNEMKFFYLFNTTPTNFKDFKIKEENKKEKKHKYQDIDFKEEYIFDLHYDFWKNYNKK